MARTRATVGCFTASARRSQQRTRTIRPFKITEILQQQKIVNIKKNGQVIKTINVRRKSRYFSGRNGLIFLKNADFYLILNYYKNILNKVHVQILLFLLF